MQRALSPLTFCSLSRNTSEKIEDGFTWYPNYSCRKNVKLHALITVGHTLDELHGRKI